MTFGSARMDTEGLRLGMFFGGLIMASVPMGLGVGIGIYVLRRHLAARRSSDSTDGSTE